MKEMLAGVDGCMTTQGSSALSQALWLIDDCRFTVFRADVSHSIRPPESPAPWRRHGRSAEKTYARVINVRHESMSVFSDAALQSLISRKTFGAGATAPVGFVVFETALREIEIGRCRATIRLKGIGRVGHISGQRRRAATCDQ
jgi:hypothetical protein